MHEETDLVECCTIDYTNRNCSLKTLSFHCFRTKRLPDIYTDENGAFKVALFLFIDRWLYRYSATHFRLTRIGIRCAHTDR